MFIVRVAGVCLVASVIAVPGRAFATSSSDCVFEWNRPTNGDAQQELSAAYAHGERGLVVVGSGEDACVLASSHDGEPTFQIYWQDGDAFFRDDDEATGRFMELKNATGALDVYLLSDGQIEVVGT